MALFDTLPLVGVVKTGEAKEQMFPPQVAPCAQSALIRHCTHALLVVLQTAVGAAQWSFVKQPEITLNCR